MRLEHSFKSFKEILPLWMADVRSIYPSAKVASRFRLSMDCKDITRRSSSMLFALCKRQIRLPRLPLVTTWQRQAIVLAEALDHAFQKFSCLIQQGDILRIADMDWRAGRVHSEGSLVFRFCFQFTTVSGGTGRRRVFMVIFCGQTILIRFHDHVHCETLAKEDQRTSIERRLFLIDGNTYEVLQIRILCDLLHKFAVYELELCLDNE